MYPFLLPMCPPLHKTERSGREGSTDRNRANRNVRVQMDVTLVHHHIATDIAIYIAIASYTSTEPPISRTGQPFAS